MKKIGILVFVLMFGVCSVASAAQWDIVFDANPEQDLLGYNVYGGIVQSGPYEKLKDCGKPEPSNDMFLHCTIDTPDGDTNWYFVITAYGANPESDESIYSIEKIGFRRYSQVNPILIKRITTTIVEETFQQ